MQQPHCFPISLVTAVPVQRAGTQRSSDSYKHPSLLQMSLARLKLINLQETILHFLKGTNNLSSVCQHTPSLGPYVVRRHSVTISIVGRGQIDEPN